VEDIAFFVLETPGYDNKDISLPDPSPFLDLPLDPAHPFNAVMAPDLDMVGTHHQLCAGKLFTVLLLGQPDTDHRCAIWVELRFFGSASISFWINSNISVGI